MRIVKRLLSVLLALTIVIGVVPMNVFAQETETQANTESEVTISSETGLGGIINNLQEQEQEENPDYSISFIEFNGKVATVNLSNVASCQLVVAVYDENTMKMLGSGVVQLEAGAPTTDVEIDIEEMPEHFLSYAFLIDENYNSLCEKYLCQRYTTDFEEFLAKEPEDFTGEDIIVFDDSKTVTDFAVLNDSAVTTESETMTYTYDEETLTYTFENATDEIKNLSVGDVFHYQYGETEYEFLIIKVKSITVDGDTAVIVEDEDITLEDAFEFVRVDAVSDFSEVEIDENELPEGMELLEETENNQLMPDDNMLAENSSAKFETTLGLNYENEAFSIDGSLALGINASAELYYDIKLFGEDYYEMKTTVGLEGKFGVEVSGKISAPDTWCFPMPSIPVGPFDFDINICPVLEFSIAGTFEVTYTNEITATIDSTNGMQKTSESSTDWDVDIGAEIDVKLGLSLEFKFSFNVPPHVKQSKRKEVAAVSVKGKVYVQWSPKTNDLNEMHPCNLCISGSVDAIADIAIGGNVEITEKIKFESDPLHWKWQACIIDTLFLSISSDGIKVGKGVCPNKYAEINVQVIDYDTKKLLSGVTVTSANCICDADGDGKLKENTIVTDSEGKATIYLKKGTHTISASKDKYKISNQSIDVLNNSKTITIYLSKTTTIPPKINDVSYNNINVGESITLGTYNGEPISWICVDIDENGPLMLAKDVLCTKEYDASGKDNKYHIDRWGYIRERYGSNCWYDSNIRQWLNSNESVVSWTHCPPSYSTESGFMTNFTESELNYVKNVTRLVNVITYESERSGYCEGGSKDTVINEIYKSSFPATNYYYDYIDDNFFLLSAVQFNNIYSKNPIYLNASSNYFTCITSGNNANCFEWVAYVRANSSSLNNPGHAYSKLGIRPAFYLNTNESKTNYGSFTYRQSETIAIEESSVVNSISDNKLSVSGIIEKTVNENECVSGEEYLLMTVCGYDEKDFVLSSENLQYIDAVIADENGNINTTIKTKTASLNDVTILTGNFSDGTKIRMYCNNPCVIGNHSFETETKQEASCTTEGIISYHCTECDYYFEDDTALVDHIYEWVVSVPSTCTSAGLKSYKCVTCGIILESETIPLTEHTPSDWIINVNAECLIDGEKVKKCTVCNETLETEIIPSLQHNLSEWEITLEPGCLTDGEKIKKCTVCNEILETEIIPATGHSYVSEITSPTCKKQGFTTHTCSACGDSYVDSYTDTIAHIEGDWEFLIAVTCTSSGLRVKKCTMCGIITKSEVIQAHHTPGEWEVSTSPTCESEGLKVKKCTVCSEVLESEVLPALAQISSSDSDVVIDENNGLITCNFDNLENIKEKVTSSNCEIVYTETDNGFGTGTKVEFVRNDVVLATYYIAVIGDLTGDGYIDAFDVSVMTSVANFETEFEENSCYAFAGDIFRDGYVDAIDLAFMLDYAVFA